MARTQFILIIFLFFSCSEKTNKNKSENRTIIKQTNSVQKKSHEEISKISQQEKDFNIFKKSIQNFKIQPIDSLEIKSENKPKDVFRIGKNIVQIFKNNNSNIEYIKINSQKILTKNLKTINNRSNGEREKMFCNSLEMIKLYHYNDNEIIFLKFSYNPCTGLGCDVEDYLIYDVKNNQINFFGNFKTTNLDFYNFPFNKNLNYISTEFQGDFNGAKAIHIISRVYSLNEKGNFVLYKDLKNRNYYYETIISLKDSTKEFRYNRNWF